jgi:hypothetical protein
MAGWLATVLAVIVGNLIFFAGGIWLVTFLGRRDDVRGPRSNADPKSDDTQP